MSSHPTPRHAAFSERALAFTADAIPFLLAWALTLRALDSSEPLTVHSKGPAAALIWGGLFLAYQAFFSCDGRVSLGKRLFGLRVVGEDGEPLDLSRALGRTGGYLFSQIFGAGFLWALLDPNGRALHDLLFGSVVVGRHEHGAGRRVAIRFAAAGVVGVLAAAWGWNNVWAPRYERIMTVAYARNGLNEYAVLQETYKARHGRYAESLFSLATVSMDPRGFIGDAAALYDQGQVAITADRDHFTVAARANDVDKTLVAISGP